LRSARGPAQVWCAHRLYLCILVLVLGIPLARVGDLPARVSSSIYRVALASVLLYNYLMLRELLPLVRPDSFDASLMRLDIRLFGFEPSLWLERLNRRPIVEWFSFFYFSYFWICITYALAVVGLSGGSRRTAEFSLGTLIVFCVGQLGYMAVPGYGPIVFLEHTFARPIDGGFFWGCVWRTVQAGSAMKDIFPSLHTAVPTWFTLFAWRQARLDPRWRWPARITGFFAANIIFSTVFLRWHYAVDVIAGLSLASATAWLAPRLVTQEESWRARWRLAGAWVFPIGLEKLAEPRRAAASARVDVD
jgi:hypothetical protein